MPQLAENFEKVVADHTAGDPVHEDVKWTNLELLALPGDLRELRIGIRMLAHGQYLARLPPLVTKLLQQLARSIAN